VNRPPRRFRTGTATANASGHPPRPAKYTAAARGRKPWSDAAGASMAESGG